MHRKFRYHSLHIALFFSLSVSILWSREIQNRGASKDPGQQVLNVSSQLPEPTLSNIPVGEVSLLPGLFRERRELTKAYLLRLKTENILQNYLLEAGVRIDTPYEQMHQGWEAPYCQLRGHFTGHWLSATAHFAALDHDASAAQRAEEVVQGLKHCQDLNGGQWVGSIPEKYFEILTDGREWIWSPQYTLHKTMMGLFDAYRYTGDKEALAVVEHSADWFSTWTEKLIRDGHGDVVYNGESAGMLELWSDLYGATKDPRYLKLAARYSMPDLFRELLAGHDPLTNDHANASIPWVQGAARLYEVTGDARYREIVTSFWKQAVEDRGMFATTGSNAGEFWIPPQQFDRFLGSRTQEHCTVYNMIRVAQYLFRWTGEARYADYIERALYNGILAQQNPSTGLVCYFLPLQPGAKKVWGSETHDFWCCQGTQVQAQAMFEDLIYYQARDGVTVSQFIPSQASLGSAGHQIRITQKTDASGDRSNFARADDTTRFVVDLAVSGDETGPWTLRIRQPGWAIGPAVVTVDGESVPAAVSKNGFIEINRQWTNSSVKIAFSKRVTQEPLPGDSQRFALLDGPVVLAALTDKEPELLAKDAITPQYEHQYAEGRNWQSGHFLVRTRQGTLTVQPLYEISDANYCVYFAATR
jgi:uncharacterized protein